MDGRGVNDEQIYVIDFDGWTLVQGGKVLATYDTVEEALAEKERRERCRRTSSTG